MHMPRKKTERERENDRMARRAHIERGMRIAVYECNQMLRPYGLRVDVPPDFIPYTVAIAEGGREGATLWERAAAIHAKYDRMLRIIGIR
jgi:hypothetical protein